MNEYFKGFEIFSDALLPIVLALVACIARQAYHGWQGVRNFLREMIICSFMGVVIYWGLDYTGYSQNVKAAITSGGAFASLTIIDALLEKAASVIRNWHGSMNGQGK